METNSIVHADFYFPLNALFDSFVNFNQSLSSRFAQSFSIRSARERSFCEASLSGAFCFASPRHRSACILLFFPRFPSRFRLRRPRLFFFPSQFNFPFYFSLLSLTANAGVRSSSSPSTSGKIVSKSSKLTIMNCFCCFFAMCLSSYIEVRAFMASRAALMTMRTSTGACICRSRNVCLPHTFFHSTIFSFIIFLLLFNERLNVTFSSSRPYRESVS